jgi:outer membrane usher protein
VVTADLATGGQPATSGFYKAIGLSHVDGRLSMVLQAQYATPGFREVGNIGSPTPMLLRNVVQASWNMGHGGSLQTAFVAQRNANDTRQQTVGVTYMANLKQGTLSASASRTTGDTRNNSWTLFYTLALDDRRSSSTTLRQDSQQSAPNATLVETLQKNLAAGPSDAYLLAAGTDGSYDAQYTRQTDTFTLNAAAARYRDLSAQQLTLSGGLTYLDGMTRATRTITDSFAIVEAGGIPDLMVYADNQPVARTDNEGLALVPNLRSYDVNRISIDPRQLPLDVSLTDPQMQIVPSYHSGIPVRFEVKRVRAGVFNLQRADGSPVPSGAVVKFQGDEFPVGLDGLTYITDYDHGSTGEAQWPDGHCRFRLPPPPSKALQPELGKILCRDSP